MAAHALRFAHAGQVRIDAPLAGAGMLPDDARRIAVDAPVTAWERAVDLCIDRDVHFLLLTPRTIDSGLCAAERAALHAGFERLAEFDIPVFWAIAPGEPAGDDLPDNVSLLHESNPSATLIREGRVAATLCLGTLDRPAFAEDGAHGAVADPPLRIRIAGEPVSDLTAPPGELPSDGTSPLAASPFHYVACCGGSREQTRTIGHEVWSDPGTTLNRSADEEGAGGVNIVEWVPGRLPEVLRAPTAAVHWQRCLIGLGHDITRDELTERLQLALLEREPALGEQLWLIDWHIVGAGPEFERLQSTAARHELAAAVEQVLGSSERLRRVHRWNLCRRTTPAGDPVAQQLRDWLAQHAQPECAPLVSALEATLRDAGAAEFAGRLSRLRATDLRSDAEQLLSEWLVSLPTAPAEINSHAARDDGPAGNGVST